MSVIVRQHKVKEMDLFANWGSGRWKQKGIVFRTPRRAVIREIHSGAIIPVQGSPGLYEIEANTVSGLRKFRDAKEVRGSDVQSDTDPVIWNRQLPDEVREALARILRQLEDIRSSISDSTQKSAVPPKPSSPAQSEVESELELAPERVLRRLQDPGIDDPERGKLIVEAEVLDFSGDQAILLTGLLRQFIDDRRESNIPRDLVAVASAIRKYVATAGTEEAFDYAACLLKASGRSPLSIELELEVTKMVVRKLTANPPASNESLPDLAARLNELSETYLNPRLLAREKHGAVALNAVMGLVLSRDRLAGNVIRRVHGLGVAWFQQLVGRRASRLKKDLEQRGLGDRYRELLQALDELSAVVSSNTSK